MVASRRLQTRANYGTTRHPVRANADMLVNSPDGWVTNQPPVNYTWIGSSNVPVGPITPLSPSVPGGMPAAVERATALLVGPLTSVLPWRVYKGTWRSDPEAVEFPAPAWMTDPMMLGTRPGPTGPVFPARDRQTAIRFWGEVLQHAVWFGKGYFTFAEDATGQPLAGAMRVLNPAMIGDLDSGGWRIGDDYDGIETDRDGRYQLGGLTWRVICLEEPFGDRTGVLGRHAQTLALAVQVRSYASGTFRSGVPAGFLKVSSANLTKDGAEELKAGWLKAHGGDQRSIAVLNATTDFTPIAISPIDAQLVQTDAMVLRTVAHAFNLHAAALDSGAQGDGVYANLTDNRQKLLDESIQPWRRSVEDELSAILPYGTWLSLDTRGFLETDSAKRTAYYAAGLAGGWLTAAEVRAIERLPPLPEQDPPEPDDEPTEDEDPEEDDPDADA